MLNGCYTIVTRLPNEVHGEMVMGSVAGPPDIWLKGGLVTQEHRERMGEAIWLYLYLQQRAWFDCPRAGDVRPDEEGKPYQHADAARVLFGSTADGQPAAIRTVKRWMAQLEGEHYVETRRLPYGLAVRITKYDAARDRARRRKERSATDGPSDLGTRTEVPQVAPPEVPDFVQRSAKSGTGEVPQPAKRSAKNGPSIYMDAGATNGTSDSSEANEVVADATRPLAPHQLIVNAYLEALGRTPSEVKGYGRYTGVGAEMAKRGDTPQDVRNCTTCLSKDPWRLEKHKPPTLEDVCVALPMWIEQGRPAKPKPTTNGAAKDATAKTQAVFRRARNGHDSAPQLPGDGRPSGLGFLETQRRLP